MKTLDLTNKKFGRLRVVQQLGKNKWGNLLWLCKCDCGKDHTVASGKLIQGKSKSCGCYANDLHIEQLKRHGITVGGKPRTFIIWNGIKARCLNPKAVNYKSYGGRGITVCDEWMSFELFHNWAINSGYSDNLTIDRIDNDKNYCPENCRWVTRKENAIRQRKCIVLTVNGTTGSISSFAREINVSRRILTNFYRLKGKCETEKAIGYCLLTGKGQIYFVNKFLPEHAA
jgi:hypothetical protein